MPPRPERHPFVCSCFFTLLTVASAARFAFEHSDDAERDEYSSVMLIDGWD